MNELKDEKRLDELISKAINTEKPQFDAEKWRQKYPDEYQTLVSRKAITSPRSIQWANILKSSITKFAAATAIMIFVVGLFLGRGRHTPNSPIARPQPVDQSLTKMMSMMSLRMAYQRGGFDSLDKQFKDNLNMLGPPLSSISLQELLEGVNEL